MQIRTFDELTDSLEADRALVHLAGFGGIFPAEQVRLMRRTTRNLADYGGVFAVEHGRLVGQIFVLRIPSAFPDGPAIVGGIAAVATAPDRARSGIARRLLTEVHRRESEAGIDFTALWTNRSWGAHRLYEKLGYRDVYFPPWAIQRIRYPSPHGADRAAVRPGRISDLAAIDRLHDDLARERLGFYRRPPRFSDTERRLGNLSPKDALLVVRRRGALLGYAHVGGGPSRPVCGELLSATARARRALLAGVHRRARGNAVAFQNSVVPDTPELRTGRSSAVLPTTWYGLLGCRLGRSWSQREAVRAFATDDRRFLCLAGDKF